MTAPSPDPRVEAAIAVAETPLGRRYYPHSDSDYRTDVAALIAAADAATDTVPVPRERWEAVTAFLDAVFAPDDADTLAALRALAGRDMACWCPVPGPCHADWLLRLANDGAA